MNRIKELFGVYRDAIEASLADGRTTQEKIDKAHSDLDMGIEEYVRFQELKTLAVADKTLTLDEGMTIYFKLGETLEQFNKLPLYMKLTLSEIFQELLEKQVNYEETKV